MSADCKWVRLQLFDRSLADAKRDPRVESHLQSCAACRAMAADVADMVAAQRQLVDSPLSEEVTSSVFEVLRPTISAQTPRRRSTHRLPVWGLAWGGAAAAAAAVTLWLVWPTGSVDSELRREVRVVRHMGDVVISPAADWPLDNENTLVREGDTITTSNAGRVEISVGNDRLVALASTAVLLSSLRRHRVELALHRGGVVVAVDPSSESNLRLQIPQGEIEVTGTIFRVDASQTLSQISVVRGSVRLHRNQGPPVDVAAGYRLIVGAPRIHEESLTPDEERETTDALSSAPWLPASDDGDTMEDEPTPPTASARRKRRLSRGRSADQRTQERIEALDELLHADQCAAAEKAALGLPASIDPTTRSQSMVLVADCYFGNDEVAAALRVYRRAARRFPRTAAGENAAFETGRVLRQQGRLQEASRVFLAYLNRYPRGVLASEARFATCAIAMDRDQFDDALGCLRRYRQKHSKSPRVPETHLLEATILRTAKKDCRGALVAYEQYLNNPGKYAEQARRWHQWCESQLSD